MGARKGNDHARRAWRKKGCIKRKLEYGSQWNNGSYQGSINAERCKDEE